MNYLDKYAVIISEICNRVEPGKKTLQKLMYLMERIGVELDLNYSIHFYGPYSSVLDDVIHILEMKDILNIDTSGLTHKISINDFDSINYQIEDKEKDKIKLILDNFSKRTASELEALTTLDYVANVMIRDFESEDEIIEKVKKIKGSKFSHENLKSEIKILRDFHFIASL